LNLFPAFTQFFCVLFGALSVGWVAVAMLWFQPEPPILQSAQRVLVGDQFKPGQIATLRRQLSDAHLRSIVRQSEIVIRLRLLDEDLKAVDRKAYAADLNDIAAATFDAISGSPADSFVWLVESWTRAQGPAGTDRNLSALRMSYALAPNEAWIAGRRASFALSIFSSLPDDLAGRAESEFVGLVRSRLYSEAANILVGVGLDLRVKLLGGLANLAEADRREFARAMEVRNLDGATVPGPNLKPSRPF
jgi:hypothetical protein